MTYLYGDALLIGGAASAIAAENWPYLSTVPENERDWNSHRRPKCSPHRCPLSTCQRTRLGLARIPGGVEPKIAIRGQFSRGKKSCAIGRITLLSCSASPCFSTVALSSHGISSYRHRPKSSPAGDRPCRAFTPLIWGPNGKTWSLAGTPYCGAPAFIPHPAAMPL